MEFIAFAFASSAGIVMPVLILSRVVFYHFGEVFNAHRFNVTNRRCLIVFVSWFGLNHSYQLKNLEFFVWSSMHVNKSMHRKLCKNWTSRYWYSWGERARKKYVRASSVQIFECLANLNFFKDARRANRL